MMPLLVKKLDEVRAQVARIQMMGQEAHQAGGAGANTSTRAAARRS